MDKLRELLINEMTKKRWSPRQLAIHMKLPNQSIHNYLDSDTVPTMKTLDKISAYFNITTSSLIGDEPINYNSPDIGPSDNNIVLKTLLDIQSRLAKIESECIKMKDLEREFSDFKSLWHTHKKKAG